MEETLAAQLFMAIKEQVNLSRNTVQGHDRIRTRAIAEEAKRRGWNLRSPLTAITKDPMTL